MPAYSRETVCCRSSRLCGACRERVSRRWSNGLDFHRQGIFPMLNAFNEPGEWLKGNLHTHTTNSDGRVTPEERLRTYAERGYDFLAFTDHNFVTSCSDGNLTVIPGSEWCVRLDWRSYHLVALNVPTGFQIFEEMAIQEAVDEVLSEGGVPIIAHPYWSGLTLADLEPVRGCVGIEVFNTTCQRIGKGCSAVHWDNLLAAGRSVVGLAVDDCHFDLDAWGAWIMVKSRYRDADSILEAVRTGRFYASRGPEIHSVARDGSTLHVECSDAAEIHFICRASNGSNVQAPEGGTIKAADFTLNDRQGYVRIEVIDAAGRAAWTNPLILG